MISVVLFKPEHAGNVGAIARVMDNFGFAKLVIVEPKCDPFSEEAFNRSKHGKNVLKKAKVISAKKLSFHRLIATTAKIGTDYNIPRSPLTPEQLIKVLPKNAHTLKKEIALLFGPEGEGLPNTLIKKADFTVTIPSTQKNRALNLSHAVTVILYELSKLNKNQKITDQFVFASAKDHEQIQKMLQALFDRLEFSTAEKKDTQRIVWKRIMKKAFLTKREAFAVMGLLRKLIE